MYIDFNIKEIDSNCNVIEKRNDAFSQELIVRSVKKRCCYDYFYKEYEYSSYIGTASDKCDISIHHDVPLDVIYKSNSSGERVFLKIEFEDPFAIVGKVIFNINGRKNIEISETDDPPSKYERFEITKEQLYELCMASSLKIQIRDTEGCVIWQGEADAFIIILQVLYNEVFDGSLFKDAHRTALSFMKTEMKKIEEKIKSGEALVKQKEQKEQQERQRRRKIRKSCYIWGVLSLVVAIIGIIGVCLVPSHSSFFDLYLLLIIFAGTASITLFVVAGIEYSD